MRTTETYRPTDWIDPRIEIRPSPIHGLGMFATAPIEKGQVVTIWGGTLLLTEDDIAGPKSQQWQAKGYVWGTIGEGLHPLSPDDQARDDTDAKWMHLNITTALLQDSQDGEH